MPTVFPPGKADGRGKSGKGPVFRLRGAKVFAPRSLNCARAALVLAFLLLFVPGFFAYAWAAEDAPQTLMQKAESLARAAEDAPQTPRQKAEFLVHDSARLARENGLDQAIAKARQAVAADPSFAEAYVQLGNLLIKKGSLDEANKVFDEALRINPILHAAKTGKGVILARKGDLNGAAAALQSALVLNPDPLLTYYELGKVYQKMGKEKEALDAFKKGIEKYKQGRD